MPTPCIVSSPTVLLTANGSPATLQADARLAPDGNRLLVENGGLRVRDVNLRQSRITNAASVPAASGAVSTFDQIDYASPSLSAYISPAAWVVPPGYAGIWRIDAGLQTDSATSPGSLMSLSIRVNAVTKLVAQRPIVAGDAAGFIASCGFDFALAEGDTINTFFANADTVARTLIASPLNFLSAHYIGPGA